MKKKEAGKTISVVIWIFLLALAAYIVLKGLSLDKGTLETIMLNVQQQAIETYLPGLTRSDGEEISPSSWLLEKTKQQIPGLNMNNNREETQEDKETSQKIVEENQEFLEAKLVEENQEAGPDSSGLEITGGTENEEDGQEETQSASTAQERVPVTDISLEQFQNFDFVLRNFYTVDSTTSITSEQLNAPALVQMDLRMKTGNDQPQILIYHTHSQEEFIDSVPGDASTTIVGVGNYLAQILKEDYGYNVIHVTDTFDIVDGKLDRNQAYNYA